MLPTMQCPDPRRSRIADSEMSVGDVEVQRRAQARCCTGHAGVMVRWSTGCEGGISCANGDFELARARLDGLAGARTWCGHGIFACVTGSDPRVPRQTPH